MRYPMDAGAAGRSFTVIYNPIAGGRRRRRFQATIDALRALGGEVRVLETTARGDAERFAREAEAGELGVLVAAGGDGTINEVINGLEARSDDQPMPPLGLIPLGTANVLAAELNLPSAPAAIARVLAEAPSRPIHLGMANGRCFSMVAGVGLDAHVVERIDPRLKRLTGKGAYVVETIGQLLGYRPVSYRVEVDGQSWDVASVIVTKGRFYAGRFVCAPQASLFEPRLHVCLFPRIGRWHALRYTSGVVLGLIHRMRDYRVVPAERVLVTGPAGEAVQGDGDIIAHLPLEVRIAPRPLWVLAP